MTKVSPLILILSQINPVPLIGTYLFKISSNIICQLHLCLPSRRFPIGLTNLTVYGSLMFYAEIIKVLK